MWLRIRVFFFKSCARARARSRPANEMALWCSEPFECARWMVVLYIWNRWLCGTRKRAAVTKAALHCQSIVHSYQLLAICFALSQHQMTCFLASSRCSHFHLIVIYCTFCKIFILISFAILWLWFFLGTLSFSLLRAFRMRRASPISPRHRKQRYWLLVYVNV